MNSPLKESQEVKKCCSACGDHFDFGSLKNGICLQCWGYSAIGHANEFIKKMLKRVKKK